MAKPSSGYSQRYNMSLAREIGEALMFLRVSHFFSVDRGDFKIRFYPTNISLRLWVSKLRGLRIYETDENFLRSYLRPGDVVIDVGANIGFHTLISSVTVGEQGRVYSIEAHPKTYKALCGNVKFNGFSNVRTYNLAAGEKQGHITFSDKKQDDRNSVVSDSVGIKVEMKPLDSVDVSTSSIALLKVDVEGYEKFVFEGGEQLLENTLCICYESAEDHFHEFGYNCQELNDILRAKGFNLFRFSNDRLLSIDKSYISENPENIIAVRNINDFNKRMGYEAIDCNSKLECKG
jgi:FkbM family methyltransferase